MRTWQSDGMAAAAARLDLIFFWICLYKYRRISLISSQSSCGVLPMKDGMLIFDFVMFLASDG